MKQAAENLEFELAADIRDKINEIEEGKQPLIHRISAISSISF